MSKKIKLYNSIASAVKDGCCEDELKEKNGVFYCECSDLNVKELKVDAIKVTKEYKSKKETK